MFAKHVAYFYCFSESKKSNKSQSLISQILFPATVESVPCTQASAKIYFSFAIYDNGNSSVKNAADLPAEILNRTLFLCKSSLIFFFYYFPRQYYIGKVSVNIFQTKYIHLSLSDSIIQSIYFSQNCVHLLRNYFGNILY